MNTNIFARFLVANEFVLLHLKSFRCRRDLLDFASCDWNSSCIWKCLHLDFRRNGICRQYLAATSNHSAFYTSSVCFSKKPTGESPPFICPPSGHHHFHCFIIIIISVDSTMLTNIWTKYNDRTTSFMAVPCCNEKTNCFWSLYQILIVILMICVMLITILLSISVMENSQVLRCSRVCEIQHPDVGNISSPSPSDILYS